MLNTLRTRTPKPLPNKQKLKKTKKSGEKTGRSPRDKRVVREPSTEADLWWASGSGGSSSPNYEMDERNFLLNRETAIGYLNSLDRVYIFDGYANWEQGARTKVRVVTERAYHALFMHNMLIRPTDAELEEYGAPDFTIYNAGAFPANRFANNVTSSTCVAINLRSKEMVILGTEYAGEMKKGVFSVMHYLMPKRGILSLHSGCNVGAAGDVTLFFGLSGEEGFFCGCCLGSGRVCVLLVFVVLSTWGWRRRDFQKTQHLHTISCVS